MCSNEPGDHFINDFSRILKLTKVSFCCSSFSLFLSKLWLSDCNNFRACHGSTAFSVTCKILVWSLCNDFDGNELKFSPNFHFDEKKLSLKWPHELDQNRPCSGIFIALLKRWSCKFHLVHPLLTELFQGNAVNLNLNFFAQMVFFKHIEAETKWPPISLRHIQINAFTWMKMYKFRIRFHWGLFSRVQLMIYQHWFM